MPPCARGGIRTHMPLAGRPGLSRSASPISATRAAFRIGARRSDVPPSVSRSLSMTIRANKAKVAQAIVVSSAVDVVEFEGNRLAIPGIPTAYLAPALLDASFEKPLLQLARWGEPSDDKNLLERK